jgi:hypothetical protein
VNGSGSPPPLRTILSRPPVRTTISVFGRSVPGRGYSSSNAKKLPVTARFELRERTPADLTHVGTHTIDKRFAFPDGKPVRSQVKHVDRALTETGTPRKADSQDLRRLLPYAAGPPHTHEWVGGLCACGFRLLRSGMMVKYPSPHNSCGCECHYETDGE